MFSPVKTASPTPRHECFERVQGLSNEAEAVSLGFTQVQMKPVIEIWSLHGMVHRDIMRIRTPRQEPHHMPSKEAPKFPNEVREPCLRAKQREEGIHGATGLDVDQNALNELIRVSHNRMLPRL